ASPKEYIGVDIEPGKFVDVVLPAERLVEHFGPESFDVVISTETLEHVQDWRLVINNMKKVLKRGGYIYNNSFPWFSIPFISL
ncbi:MAG: class I SAM-dependent methyltransferase, partial [Thermoprotei archaeon]